uniref:Small ribosomal subunit protein uS3m n=1 Tax=Araucaria heterophylla TaxID=34341 RepID=D2DX78_ARAHE|nr:ribosomal protein S3 [Araucaria heterophylla]AJP33449.1 ribosomal protein S3 [Araucaria heterophylla]QJH91767.1 ribosomal protein S3 [Araucaria heterophylla]QXE43702.1 ribosomal protein S3 [Araucaria cunninghamii]
MARKANPISVRLHPNRSSDSNWFSDNYYGKLVYQDVNSRDYFGSIRPPTRKTFGFRLGKCILHHSPKRTFIHLFFPRRPFLKRRRRGRRGPGKRREDLLGGLVDRAFRIGGTEERQVTFRIGGTEERQVRSSRTLKVESIGRDHRSEVIRRTRQRCGYHDRSPWSQSLLGGDISKLLFGSSSRMAHKPSVSDSPSGFLFFFLQRIRNFLGGPNDLSHTRNKSPCSSLVVKIYLRRSLSILEGLLPRKKKNLLKRTSLLLLKENLSRLKEVIREKKIRWKEVLRENKRILREKKRKKIFLSILEGLLLRKKILEVRKKILEVRKNIFLSIFKGLPRKNKKYSLLLLQTIFSVRSRSNYLVMLYFFHMENQVWIWPVARKKRDINPLNRILGAPDSSSHCLDNSSFHSLDKRIRFFVESLTAKTRFARTTETREPLDLLLKIQRVEPSPSPLPVELPGRVRGKKVEYQRVGKVLGYRASSECCDHSLSPHGREDRSSVFPFFGATLFFLRDFVYLWKNAQPSPFKGEVLRDLYSWICLRHRLRKQISSRRRLRLRLLRVFRIKLRGSSRLVGESIDLGGIGIFIWDLERLFRGGGFASRGHYFLNEVRKMRSLLSDGTNTNTFIAPVKIESVFQSASLIAQDTSFLLKSNIKRSFRSIFNQIVRSIPKVTRERVRGIRIRCSGRLKGAKIARTEHRKYRKPSCNAFGRKIDYAYAKVFTRYGILGVKVWISFR